MFKQQYPQEVYDFINDNINMVGLRKAIQEKFGITFSKSAIDYYRRKHKGIKRRNPKNKPTFLSKPIGTERIDKDGYVKVMVKGGVERLKHHVIWESVNKPLKDDECLLFLDGNRLNCSIENLYLIKRKYISTLTYMIKKMGIITPEQRKSLILCAGLKIEADERELKLKAKSPRRRPKGNNYIIVKELYEQGLLPSQIANKLNKSVSVIHWTLRRLKLGCYDD